MKIIFTQYRELPDGRRVKPGDVMSSTADNREETLRAFVTNGIARDVTEAPPTIIQTKEVSADER